MIRLTLNATYQTRNGLLVRILSAVSNPFVGRTITVHLKDGGTTRELVPTPYFRAVFVSTGEVVFYSENGNIISEKPSGADQQLAISRLAAVS